MADDLIIKFFREDLTEAEEQALSQLLASSVEDALRLGQHAETSYYHYGLPEPQWPGNPPRTGFPRAGGLKIWFSLALMAGLLAWAGWKYASRMEGDSKPLATATVPTPAPVVSKPKPTHPATSHKSLDNQALEDLSKSKPAASKGSTLSSPPVSRNAATPAVTPVNVGDKSHPSHSNLEVVVHQKKAGLVKVQVLSPEETPVVLLYEGMLQPGSWAFDWNGLLADGGTPPPGTYQIQVQSGTATLSKKIHLQKQP